LAAYLLDAGMEQTLESGVEHTENSSHLNLPPLRIREILERITARLGAGDSPLVVIASSGARYFLRQIVENSLPNLSVISHNEVPPGVKILSLGVLGC